MLLEFTKFLINVVSSQQSLVEDSYIHIYDTVAVFDHGEWLSNAYKPTCAGCVFRPRGNVP